MSNDRIPVALKHQPKWWNFATEGKRAAAVLAAFREFDGCDVHVTPFGVKVLCSVPYIGALDHVTRGNARLEAAVEYACVDMADSVIDVAA